MSQTPVILLAFANDDGRSLRHLGKEQRILTKTLRQAEKAGRCIVQVLPAATADDIIQAFQEYRGRIKVFHYGGHSDDDEVFLQASYEQGAGVQANSLAAFLSAQPGLELFFLNSCLSLPQAEAYYRAGVKAVIATDKSIGDRAASDFADLFYRALASGASIGQAFEETKKGFKVKFETTYRGLYRRGSDQLPWQIYPQAPHYWHLPPAAKNKPTAIWWQYVTAAAVVVGILGGLAEFLNFINLFPNENAAVDAGSVTVLAHGPKGKDELVLPNRGRVKLIYGDALISEQLNDEGEATFKQIPESFFEEGARVEVLFEDPKGESYRAAFPDSSYALKKGAYIDLEVRLEGMDRLEGTVKDFETGAPIDSALIRIRGLTFYSNEFGEFTIEIPEDRQQKFIDISATKAGYVRWELSNVPVATEKPLIIGLKKTR